MSQPSPPRRGHRDPEGRRRAILHAAAELIVENGATGISHRAIAQRAGVSLGSTTQYFDSLDELREAALQLLADDIDEQLAKIERGLFEATRARTESATDSRNCGGAATGEPSSEPRDESSPGIDDTGTAASTIADAFVGPMYEFLEDRRGVAADLALISTGALDPNMRPLARRWNDRLVAILTPYVGSLCASAITVYLDGATVHAGLHDAPLDKAELTRTLHALLTLNDPERLS